MKTRGVTIFSGDKFTVPQGIQRIDTRSTHGWQVRYHGTKFFSDGTPDGSGAKKSLERATRELLSRIATLPAPVSIKRMPSQSKSSDLPPGISGPKIVSKASTGSMSAVLSVVLPRFGQAPTATTVYIGTPNTYTQARYRAAVAEAKALRAEALKIYEEAATTAKRKEAAAMKKTLRAGARA